MELWDSEVTGFVPSAEPFSFRHLVENRLPQKRGTLWGRGEGGKAGDGGGRGGLAGQRRHAGGWPQVLGLVSKCRLLNSQNLKRDPQKQYVCVSVCVFLTWTQI